MLVGDDPLDFYNATWMEEGRADKDATTGQGRGVGSGVEAMTEIKEELKKLVSEYLKLDLEVKRIQDRQNEIREQFIKMKWKVEGKENE